MMKGLVWCVLLWTVLLHVSVIDCQNWLVEHLLPQDYNKNDAPFRSNSSNETIPLNFTIQINGFSTNMKENVIQVEMDLCLKWNDHRIESLDNVVNANETFSFTKVTLTDLSRFWTPNVYFRNALSSKKVNVLGDIQYSNVWPTTKLIQHCSKMSFTFVCKYQLSNFPFDQQICQFELEDFEKATQHLSIRMENINASIDGSSKERIWGTLQGECDPILLDTFMWNETESSKPYSCAYGAIRLVRHVSYYVIRYYAPTFLKLIMSYVSFWLPTNAWPARVMLMCTVLLNVLGDSSSGYNEVPAHSVVSFYWWFWCIQCLMYFTLVEYALALAWVQFVIEKKLSRSEKRVSPDGYYFGKNNWYAKLGGYIEMCLHGIFGPIDFFDRPQERNKVDYIARVLFPILTFIFIIAYICSTIPAWSRYYSIDTNK